MSGPGKNPDVKPLLSPNSYKYLVWSVKISSWVKCIPYKYDDETKKFVFDDSRRTRILWLTQYIIFNMYMTFVGLRWIQNAMIDSSSPAAMGSLYVALNYQCVNAIQLSISTCYGSHHQWLNMFFGYLEELQESQGRNLRTSPSVSNDCGPLLRIFFVTSFIIYILDTYSMYLSPDQSYFLSSLASDPENMTVLDTLPFGMFHNYMWIYQWTSMLFYYSAIICYLTGIQNALEAIRCTIVVQEAERIRLIAPIQIEGQGQIINRRQSQGQIISRRQSQVQGKDEDEAGETVISILGAVELFNGESIDIVEAAKKMTERQRPTLALIGQNPTQFAREYRTIEILQNFFNKIWGTCNACYEVSFICGSVLGFYNAVTLEKGRALHQFSVGLFFTYTLMMIWQQMGIIFEHSSDILGSWILGKVGRPFFQRFMRSAKPIRTNIGGFFYADRGIRLTILAIIFDRTTSLLLSD